MKSPVQKASWEYGKAYIDFVWRKYDLNNDVYLVALYSGIMACPLTSLLSWYKWYYYYNEKSLTFDKIYHEI